MSDELSEEHRLKIFRELNEAAHQAGFPNFDAEGLAAGHLAGPAWTDPVPVWEYLDYVAKHPEVSIDEISQVRFPISFHGGGSTVTSIAEYTAAGPVPPTFVVTAEDIVRLYVLMHDAGAMQWNAGTRTIEELKPRASYAPAIYEKWRSQLEPRGKYAFFQLRSEPACHRRKWMADRRPCQRSMWCLALSADCFESMWGVRMAQGHVFSVGPAASPTILK